MNQYFSDRLSEIKMALPTITPLKRVIIGRA
jgi:hypothetical protein